MIDFTLRELECFHAVAETLNFTRAAERLHLSQPPLSRHIRELERRLGVRLFDRTRRRVAPTAAGRRFQSDTRGVLEQLTRARQRARRHAAGVEHTLDIAFVGALLSESLVRRVRKYRERRPDIGITLHDHVPAVQVRAVAEGAIDLGFLGPAPRDIPEGVEVKPWFTEPVCAVMPGGHPLAGRKRISLARLEGESLLTVSHEAAPAYDQWLQARFVEAGVPPLFVQRADRAQAVCSMAAVGGGIALLTASACRLLEDCVSIPLMGPDGAYLRLTHVVAYRPGGSKPAREFLNE